MTKGNPGDKVVMRTPASAGLIADARLRGTAVTLAAAVRSPGATTAITYEVRVGTSICDSAERTSNNPSVVKDSIRPCANPSTGRVLRRAWTAVHLTGSLRSPEIGLQFMPGDNWPASQV